MQQPEHAILPDMQGQNSTPPGVVTWIESMTPSPTPDPTFPLITDIDTAVNKTQDLFQKVTGFNASAGGFNQAMPLLPNDISGWLFGGVCPLHAYAWAERAGMH